YYRPASIVVAAAGNLDHDEFASAVERRCVAATGDRPARLPRPPSSPRPVRVSRRPTEQAHVVVGMRALDRDDPDRYALAVLNQVLGGGMSSRLFQEIRERRGLAYSVYSYRQSYLETGALAVYAGTAPARVPEVLELV